MTKEDGLDMQTVIQMLRQRRQKTQRVIKKRTRKMKKNVNICIDLKTIMQEDTLLNPGQCYRGVLSRTEEDVYLFEEAAPANHVHRRNPKLFEGRYVSLVHMQNGRYQIHMRTIDASALPDSRLLAQQVYRELLDAFCIID
jgi:hypothetical protein